MAVYSIYANYSDEYETQGGLVDMEILDGDFETAFPIGDYEFHPVTKAARMKDGTRIKQNSAYQGVAVDMSGLPKRIMLGGGKRKLGDLLKTAGHFFISEKMRDIVEQLEPGVHQFAPVELIWKQDDSYAASYFWFNPCNRIDGMDQNQTTHRFNERLGTWSQVNGGEFVVKLSQLNSCKIWFDSRTNSFGNPFVTEDFKQAMEGAKITGVGYHQLQAV